MDTIVFGTPQPPTSSITPHRSLVRVVQPTVEPISLAEAKVQCRVDTEDSDAYITTLITVARQYLEDVCDVTFISSVWEAKYDLFPIWQIILPRPPMAPGDVTVTYRRGDGTYGTLTSAAGDFQVDTSAIPGRIYPNWASSWPATRGDENSVTVRYSAGYGPDGRSVPATARHLMLFLVSHWYDSRQLSVTGGQVQVPYAFRTLLAASGLGIYR